MLHIIFAAMMLLTTVLSARAGQQCDTLISPSPLVATATQLGVSDAAFTGGFTAEAFDTKCLQAPPPIVTPDRVVESLNPRWLRLRVTKAVASQSERLAAITVCGTDTWTCDKAAFELRRATAQCTEVYLGVIDRSLHPNFPLDFFKSQGKVALLRQAPGEPLVEEVVVEDDILTADRLKQLCAPSSLAGFMH